MFCKNCGTQNADGTKFCTNCGQPLEAAPVQPAQNQTTVIIQQQAAPKKNNATFALAIVGFIFSLVGAILWLSIFAAAADCIASLGITSSKLIIYCVVFAVLGVGGSIVALVGGVQARNYKQPAGLVMCIVGLLCQIGMLIAQIVASNGHFGTVILFAMTTILGVLFLLIATCFAWKKAPAQN